MQGAHAEDEASSLDKCTSGTGEVFFVTKVSSVLAGRFCDFIDKKLIVDYLPGVGCDEYMNCQDGFHSEEHISK